MATNNPTARPARSDKKNMSEIKSKKIKLNMTQEMIELDEIIAQLKLEIFKKQQVIKTKLSLLEKHEILAKKVKTFYESQKK